MNHSPTRHPTLAFMGRDEVGFSAAGVNSVQVRVPWGMIYEFSDMRTLQSYMQTGKVAPDDHISLDGEHWVAIGPRTDLEANMRRAYRFDRDGRPLKSVEEHPTQGRSLGEATFPPVGRPSPHHRPAGMTRLNAWSQLNPGQMLLCLAGVVLIAVVMGILLALS